MAGRNVKKHNIKAFNIAAYIENILIYVYDVNRLKYIYTIIIQYIIWYIISINIILK